jgi:hypothetical protein
MMEPFFSWQLEACRLHLELCELWLSMLTVPRVVGREDNVVFVRFG